MAHDELSGRIPNVFSEYLEPPQYVSTARMPPSGFMGPAGKSAYLVDSFLGGLSRGRMLAHARSEQERVNGERSIMATIQAVANSPLSPTEKQTQTAGLYKMLAGSILGNIDGGNSGKKSKRGAEGQPGQQHPVNHVVAAVKNILTDIAGPGAEKQAYTPQQIKAETNKAFAAIQNAKNYQSAQVQNADARLQKIYAGLYSSDGKPPTQDQLNKSADWNQAVGAAMAITGNRLTPFLASVAQAQKDREAQARIAADNAITASHKSEVDRNEATAEALRRRGIKLFENPKGEAFSFDGSVYRDAAGNIIPGNDPRLQGLHTIGAAAHVAYRALKDGTIGMFQGTQFLGLAPGPDGKPARVSTPEGRDLLREGFVQQRFNQNRADREQHASEAQQARTAETADRINRFYDAQRLKAERDASLSDDERNAQLKEIEESRQAELKSIQQPQATAPPPQRRSASGQTGAPPPKSEKSAAPPKTKSGGNGKIAPAAMIDAYMRLHHVTREQAIKKARESGYTVEGE